MRVVSHGHIYSTPPNVHCKHAANSACCFEPARCVLTTVLRPLCALTTVLQLTNHSTASTPNPSSSFPRCPAYHPHSTLDWGWSREWAAQPSELWYDAQGAPAGWRRNMSTLTQAMVRGAGHMAPRDAPAAMRTLVYGWLEQAAADWSEARRAADALTPAVLLS